MQIKCYGLFEDVLASAHDVNDMHVNADAYANVWHSCFD